MFSKCFHVKIKDDSSHIKLTNKLPPSNLRNSIIAFDYPEYSRQLYALGRGLAVAVNTTLKSRFDFDFPGDARSIVSSPRPSFAYNYPIKYGIMETVNALNVTTRLNGDLRVLILLNYPGGESHHVMKLMEGYQACNSFSLAHICIRG